MKRRKDIKGRVLKDGESQRKDGRYQYRWTDRFGKRHTIYSDDLKNLREKEKTATDETIFNPSNVTVYNLVENYAEKRKLSIKASTLQNEKYCLRTLKKFEFSRMLVSEVKTDDAKKWVQEAAQIGNSYGALHLMLCVVRPAFDEAVENKMILQNPFSFKLSKIVSTSKPIKKALTQEQYDSFMEFVHSSKSFSKRYDLIGTLYETGIRVSELCGLTFDNVDFDKKTLVIDHQLLWTEDKGFYIEKPKTKSGIRVIPLSNKAIEYLSSAMKKPRPQREPVVDDCTCFIFLTNYGDPLCSATLETRFRYMVDKYRKTDRIDIPNITPHTFRHTFCTRMIESGMNIKAVQYLMGHSNVKITLDVYTHISYKSIEDDFHNLVG